MERYDLCVIGGGPSGYAAAMRAIDFGKKVLLIEKDKIGGAGLYNGALWSKTMWEYSQKIMQIRQETGENHASFEGMMKMVDEALFDRKFQMTVHMKLLHEETDSKLFHYEKGKAYFVDAHHIQVQKKNELKKQATLFKQPKPKTPVPTMKAKQRELSFIQRVVKSLFKL